MSREASPRTTFISVPAPANSAVSSPRISARTARTPSASRLSDEISSAVSFPPSAAARTTARSPKSSAAIRAPALSFLPYLHSSAEKKPVHFITAPAPRLTGDTVLSPHEGYASLQASFSDALTASHVTPSAKSASAATREDTLRTPLPSNFSCGGVRNLATLSA